MDTVIEVYETESAVDEHTRDHTYSTVPIKTFVFPAHWQIVTIGNSDANDVCLPHKYLSRFHAVIVREAIAPEGILRDLSSNNGTYMPQHNRVEQASLGRRSTIYIRPYKLVIDLAGQVDPYDRVRFDEAGDTDVPRLPGALTSSMPGRLDALKADYPERADFLHDLEALLERTRHRGAILDWLVRRAAHALHAAECMLRLSGSREIIATAKTLIKGPAGAATRLAKKKHAVDGLSMAVPLLEGDPARLVGDWTLVRAKAQGAPFTEGDARFLTRLAAWVLKNCPTGGTDATVSRAPAKDWPVALVGASEPYREMMKRIQDLGPRSGRVLLSGPVGAGKSTLAQVIHERSGRGGAFVKVNAAVDENSVLTLQYRIFGGRADGRDASVPGALEEANKGTLFLDEIGDMPLPVQATLKAGTGDTKTTTVEFTRWLETTQRCTDVRIVSGTSKDLDSLVVEGKFDPAFLSRIRPTKDAQITVPPLTGRDVDVLLLAHSFLDLLAKRDGRLPHPLRISQPAKALLLAARWDDNVRELYGVMETAYGRAMARMEGTWASGPAARAEMPHIAEVGTRAAVQALDPEDKYRLPEDIQPEDLDVRMKKELPMPPEGSRKERILNEVMRVLTKWKGDMDQALNELDRVRQNVHDILDDGCIPRYYGQPGDQLASGDRAEAERMMDLMRELAEPGLRLGAKPKDLAPFYQAVMARLATLGYRYPSVKAFGTRLDELRIPRHYPVTTEQVRAFWRTDEDPSADFAPR